MVCNRWIYLRVWKCVLLLSVAMAVWLIFYTDGSNRKISIGGWGFCVQAWSGNPLKKHTDAVLLEDFTFGAPLVPKPHEGMEDTIGTSWKVDHVQTEGQTKNMAEIAAIGMEMIEVYQLQCKGKSVGAV